MTTRVSRRFNNHSRLKLFIAETAVEALDIAVLPRISWIDIQCFNPVFTQRFFDILCDKFGAVIGPDMLGDAVGCHRLPKRG